MKGANSVADGSPRRCPSVIAVNEEFAHRYLSDSDPIGAALRLPGPTDAGYLAEIVAVVRNSKYRTLGEEQRPAIYEVYAQRVTQHRVAHVFVRATENGGPTTRDVAQASAGARSHRLRRREDDEACARVCLPAESSRRRAPRVRLARSA